MRSPGGQKGYAGPPFSLPLSRMRSSHSVSVYLTYGTSLEDADPIAVEQRQIYDNPPIRVIVTEHRAEYKWCPHCRCSHQVAFPAEAAHSVQYGTRLKAFRVYSGTYQLRSCDQVCGMVSGLFGVL